MGKKKQPTLYSNKNNVNINNLLNASQNIISQFGGRKNKKDEDDNNSDISEDSDSDTDDTDDDKDNKETEDDIEDNKDKDDIDEKEDDDDDDNNEKLSIESDKDSDDDKLEDSGDEKSDKDNKESDDNKSDIDDEETIKKNCYSKYASVDSDDVDLEELFADDEFKLTKNLRLSKPILFKYEKVRLLSTRAKQLAHGAKPMLKNTEGLSSKEIALLELKNKIIPLIIERPIPNSGIERWKLSELEIVDFD